MDSVDINLNQLIYALSDALDLVGVDDVHHGKRVAWMAQLCAQNLGWDDGIRENLFQGALLHDCGVSSTKMHEYLVNEFDWEGAEAHCAQGYKLLGIAPRLHHLRQIVLYHHTPYRVLKSLDIDEQVKLIANLIFLVDRVDVLHANYCAQNECRPLDAKSYVLDTISSLDEGHFSKKLVETFLHVSEPDSFWIGLENVRPLLRPMCDMKTKTTLPLACLRTIAMLFSCFVDAKSAFTAEHSLDVANLSILVANYLEIDASTIKKLEIAALLHDLGKLRIPDSILDKPGSLTPDEYRLVQRHAEDTYSILSQIEGLEDIAIWAGDHHEKLNGRGYPRLKNHVKLPLVSRIITACDMFQALVQNRPYRKPMSLERALDILNDAVQKDELDSRVVACIVANSDECFKAATTHSNNLNL